MVPEAKDVSLLVGEWKEKLLREEQAGQEHFGGEIIVGPRDLVIREILVERYLRPNIPDLVSKARSTTVFLWELGEGPEKYRRRGTRIGGTPWWPAERPWPLDSSGTPLRFVAQIDFGVEHSLDIKLPGELLSIFIHESEDYLWGQFEFFWHTPTPRTETLKVDWVPQLTSNEYVFGPFFGHPYRTYDYELYDIHSYTGYFAYRDLLETLIPKVGWADLVPVMQASKIGGIPYFIQGGASDKWEASWTFLCTLSSVNISDMRSTPEGLLVNQPEPQPEVNKFMLGDVGQMYVYLDQSGTIKYWWDCT